MPPQRSVVGLSSKRIPNRQEVARKSSLPLGMLVCPLAPMLKPTPCLRRPAVACATCGGYINKYCQRNFAKGEWKCVLCDATNTNQEEYGDESCAQFPEFINKVRSHSQTHNCCSPQREPSQLTLTINERALCTTDGRVSRSVAAVLSWSFHTPARLLLHHRRQSRSERH